MEELGKTTKTSSEGSLFESSVSYTTSGMLRAQTITNPTLTTSSEQNKLTKPLP
jgi:hypothetical protein